MAIIIPFNFATTLLLALLTKSPHTVLWALNSHIMPTDDNRKFEQVTVIISVVGGHWLQLEIIVYDTGQSVTTGVQLKLKWLTTAPINRTFSGGG